MVDIRGWYERWSDLYAAMQHIEFSPAISEKGFDQGEGCTWKNEVGSRKESGQAGQESISRSEAGNAASHLEEILFDLGTDLLESSLV